MQKIGLFLLLIGAATIAGYFIYGFVMWVAPLMPWPLKIAIAGGGGVGGILILGSLIRERIKKSKEEREKFKEVDH